MNKKIQLRQKKFVQEIEDDRTYYSESAKEVRNKLINHFLSGSETSAVNPRYEGAFGLALFGLTLFIEIVFYRTSLSIIGRVTLRTLVEVYILFEYLLKKERNDSGVWAAYRDYGIGRMKIIHLKATESKINVQCINKDAVSDIVNEDRWIEFVPINLGHWDSADLRKMSEEVGLKDLYDSYYDYSSGFVHGNWGSVRESIYQRCVNSLHRFHRIPQFDLPLMPSVFEDAREIINKILDCLSVAYPSFDERFIKSKVEEVENNQDKK